MLGENEKPDVTYADVGGLDMQKQEIREAVELPLTHFELYKQIGGYMLMCSPCKCSRLLGICLLYTSDAADEMD